MVLPIVEPALSVDVPKQRVVFHHGDLADAEAGQAGFQAAHDGVECEPFRGNFQSRAHQNDQRLRGDWLPFVDKNRDTAFFQGRFQRRLIGFGRPRDDGDVPAAVIFFSQKPFYCRGDKPAFADDVRSGRKRYGFGMLFITFRFGVVKPRLESPQGFVDIAFAGV